MSFSAPFNALVEHCDANNIRCHADAENKFIGFSMCGEAAVYKCAFRVTHDDSILQIEIMVPVLARDAKARPLALETVVRANRGLAIGSFNIDMADGEVSYHVGHVIGEAGLDDQTIGRLFATAMTTVDRYFPALMRVLYGGHTPEDAVYLAELDVHTARVEEEPARPSPAPQHPAQPASSKASAPKKTARRRRKNPGTPKPGDLPGLFDPSKGDRPDRA